MWEELLALHNCFLHKGRFAGKRCAGSDIDAAGGDSIRHHPVYENRSSVKWPEIGLRDTAL